MERQACGKGEAASSTGLHHGAFMVTDPAIERLGKLVTPLSPAAFLDGLSDGRFIHMPGEPDFERVGLLGDDPTELLIGAWESVASKLGFHAVTASGPPPAVGPATSKEDFRNRIRLFHERGYSVRFPDLRPFAPAVDRMARALEKLVHQPVTVGAFWSKSGLRAPVHFDDRDTIAVQIIGEKPWHISGGLSPLRTNQMIMADEAVAAVPDPVQLTMKTGDALYVPRGLAHTVDGQEESLHISFMFSPVTVGDAAEAVLDELTSADRATRETIGGDWRAQLARGDPRDLVPAILQAVARLQNAASAPEFVQAALRNRSARAIRGMEPLRPAPHPKIGLGTPLKQSDGALSVMVPGDKVIELNYPGGKIYIHRGVEQALAFMVEQPEFRLAEVPGGLPAEVRVALAEKLLSIGYLTVGG